MRVVSSILVLLLLQSSSTIACKARRYLQKNMIEFF
jgi:hypothetical protein